MSYKKETSYDMAAAAAYLMWKDREDEILSALAEEAPEEETVEEDGFWEDIQFQIVNADLGDEFCEDEEVAFEGDLF